MTTTHPLTPAAELVKLSEAHFPNESNEYRQARNALLAEEIELRRHIERVAATPGIATGGRSLQELSVRG